MTKFKGNGKDDHDDAPDCTTGIAETITGKRKKAKIRKKSRYGLQKRGEMMFKFVYPKSEYDEKHICKKDVYKLITMHRSALYNRLSAKEIEF